MFIWVHGFRGLHPVCLVALICSRYKAAVGADSRGGCSPRGSWEAEGVPFKTCSCPSGLATPALSVSSSVAIPPVQLAPCLVPFLLIKTWQNSLGEKGL